MEDLVGILIVMLDDKWFFGEVEIDLEDGLKLVDGYKVIVELMEYVIGYVCVRGVVKLIIGYCNDLGVDILLIIYKYGILIGFLEEVME